MNWYLQKAQVTYGRQWRANRRSWLVGCMAGAGIAALSWSNPTYAGAPTSGTANGMSEPTPEQLAFAKREVIRPLLYSRKDLDEWLAGKAFPFSKYDSELGYVHIDRQFKEGLDGAICTYSYDPNGARHMFAYADQPCRISTFGNSFTSCEQVSDHETWQEVLAGHLGEPIRNFGTGGYSVYQAYLRMRREEQCLPSKCIIFNIYDDDHYRSLNGWQRPRFSVRRIATDPPIPHVKVDPDSNSFIECPNPCPTPQSLYQLCDLESAIKIFADDYGVSDIARREALRIHQGQELPHGLFHDSDYTRRALYSTMRIVELVERFARQQSRQVLFVLSCGVERLRRFVKEGKRFDASLVDFFDQRGLHYVDLMKSHVQDLDKADLETYLRRHFIVPYTPRGNSGHYTPLGNFFCAFALKSKIVEMLHPKPPAFNSND